MHSVYYVFHEEQSHVKESYRILVPSFHSLRMERLEPWPPFGDQERLAFYDSGFPTEARVKPNVL